jgi:hypothetical protein
MTSDNTPCASVGQGTGNSAPWLRLRLLAGQRFCRSPGARPTNTFSGYYDHVLSSLRY